METEAEARADRLVESWRREALEARRLRALVRAWAAAAFVGLAGLALTTVSYRLAAVEWARALDGMEARALAAEAACPER